MFYRKVLLKSMRSAAWTHKTCFKVFKRAKTLQPLRSQKILILADTPGWIVDRITDEMIKRIPFNFTKRYYTQIDTNEFVNLANKHDLVHYQNWDWLKHIERFDDIKVPVITSIRSFRFPNYIYELNGRCHFHIINPDQRQFFSEATYIPDGIFPFKRKSFVVGFAGRADDYKGYNIIKQACEELGVTFKPAFDVPPDQMQDYYDSINLYVCASIAEGHSTPVMECLSINKPVLTTDVGIPKFLNVHKCERNLKSIKKGIERFYTQDQVNNYTWENCCNQFVKLYETRMSSMTSCQEIHHRSGVMPG